MPYVNLQITKGATRAQKAEIVKAFTDTLVRVLGKNPQNTHIVIQEIEREDWGHGGELVADKAALDKAEPRLERPENMNAIGEALRRRGDPQGFSDPVARGLRQAARLSRQRRLGAEAENRDRGDVAADARGLRQCPSRPALPRQRLDRGL
jgi:4-oxalocrotonate tautomerase